MVVITQRRTQLETNTLNYMIEFFSKRNRIIEKDSIAILAAYVKPFREFIITSRFS